MISNGGVVVVVGNGWWHIEPNRKKFSSFCFEDGAPLVGGNVLVAAVSA